MAAATRSAHRLMLQRSLIEGDDRQTQRSWYLEAEGTFLTTKDDPDGRLCHVLRLTDIPLLIEDLQAIVDWHAVTGCEAGANGGREDERP